MEHHGMSMSKWSTWAVCPHFTSTSKQSTEAAEGTLAHSDVAEVYSLLRDNTPEENLGDYKYQQSVWCAKEWLKLTKMEDVEDSENFYCVGVTEQRVRIDSSDKLLDGIYGYADYVRVIRTMADSGLERITVADFKTFSDGTSCYDEQLAGYAVAVGSTIPDATDDVKVELIVAHGAIRRCTKVVTTLGECRDLASDVVRKRLSKNHFQRVCNKMCKYCKFYPCDSAIAFVNSVIPNFEKLKIGKDEMQDNPNSVPLILSAMEDVQRIIDDVKERGREIIKSHGKEEECNGLTTWTLGDDNVQYAVKQTKGSRVIEDTEKVLDETYEYGTEFLAKCVSFSVGSLLQEIKKKRANAGIKISTEELAKEMENRGVITHRQPSERLVRTK